MDGRLHSLTRSNSAIRLWALGFGVLAGGLGILASCNDPTGGFSNKSTLMTPDASLGSSGGSSSSGGVGGSSSGSGSGSSSGSSSSSSSGGVQGTSNGCPPGLEPTIDAVTGMTGLCVDPGNVNKNCPGSREWLPNTPPITTADLFKPLQHPFPECPFYRFGFQNFLIATQPNPAVQDINGNNEAAIVTYATIDDLFQKSPQHALPDGGLAPQGTHRGTSLRSWLGDIRQAGARQIALDQSGHTLYYGIQANDAFANFLASTQVTLPNGTTTTLNTLEGVKYAPPTLSLPPGLVEFKDAWIDIDPLNGTTSQADFQNFQATYITTQAWIPVIHQDVTGTVTGTKGTIYEDRDHPIQHWVALVAMHVVYTIPGHPEFVWASFQHIDGNGNPDTSGIDPVRPQDDNNSNNANVDVCPGDAGINYLLCSPGTLARNGNRSINDQDLKFDEDAGLFHLAEGGVPAAVHTYRVFPGSKSNSDNPDDDVVSLNANMDRVWAQVQTYAGGSLLDGNDRRMFYRLVGAQWMDKPGVFTLNLSIANENLENPLLASPDAGAGPVPLEQADERASILASGLTTADGGTLTGMAAALYDVTDPNGRGTDSPFSILGGEERMSSTVMETFTQPPGSFFNCFKCHNTEAVTVQGIPTVKDPVGVQLLKPKLINVSHLFSQFVLEECTFANHLVDGGPAACGPNVGP